MKTNDFINKKDSATQVIFKTLNEIIRKHDSSVTVEVGSIMSVKEALVYKQDDVFKYGLTATKNHYSYHSMVMYAYPQVLTKFKKLNTKIKFQKGCFNFKSIEDIDLKSFDEFLKQSATIDFSPVIEHYKNK